MHGGHRHGGRGIGPIGFFGFFGLFGGKSSESAANRKIYKECEDSFALYKLKVIESNARFAILKFTSPASGNEYKCSECGEKKGIFGKDDICAHCNKKTSGSHFGFTK